MVALQQAFTVEDIERICSIKPCRNRQDELIWGFSKSGWYNSKSGYKLLEAMVEANIPQTQRTPPLEKALWNKLWKSKAPSKLRHFMWKAISGALAVKERLASRKVLTDSSCSVCSLGPETICHTLFQCLAAKEVWNMSGFPLPTHGFSSSSVFLNMHFLLECSSKSNTPKQLRWSFPWILWQIWKARNAFMFENTKLQPSCTIEKALEDAEIWLRVNNHLPQSQTPARIPVRFHSTWSKPITNVLKCNFGASWANGDRNGGAAWLVRDHHGQTLFHSRRSYAFVNSIMEAELLSLLWAVESISSLRLDRVIFESSLVHAREAMMNASAFPHLQLLVSKIHSHLNCIRYWSLDYAADSSNAAAMLIANSVTAEQRLRSYVARNGPSWIRHILDAEAL